MPVNLCFRMNTRRVKLLNGSEPARCNWRCTNYLGETGKPAFAASLALVARGRVDMGMDALNRITGGSTTVIRKFIQIFDD